MLTQVCVSVSSSKPAGQDVHSVAVLAHVAHSVVLHAAHTPPLARYVPSGHVATHAPVAAIKYGVADSAAHEAHAFEPAPVQVPHVLSHATHEVPSEYVPGPQPWRQAVPPGCSSRPL